MIVTGHNLIAGIYSHEGSQTFTSVDPRNRMPGAVRFHNASAAEIDRAVQAAADAFERTRRDPASRRAELLDRVAGEIEALGDDLLQTTDAETGLGLARLAGERARTTGQLRAFADLLREGSYVEAIIDTALPDRQPAPRPDVRRMLFPSGPVAVFSASNFPFAFSVAGGDTASAFAAGCPVIVKGHPSHPATAERVAQAVARAVAATGFPAGFFSLLQGDTAEVGQTLVQHPRLEAVGFTGSLRAGRALFDTAARRPRPIPVYAEMSSINPMILLPGAIAAGGEALADQLVASVTLGSGQFCTSPGLILVQDAPETQRFIAAVRERMAAREPGVLLNEKVEQGLAHAVEQTLTRPGVTCVIGGRLAERPGYSYANTVLQATSDVFRADEALQDEHFGPVTLFVVCNSFADLRATAAALHGSLTATLHAQQGEWDAAAQLLDLLCEKAGRLIWNGFPTGVEVVHAMQHGGPYPATSAPATTSVGMMAIRRFLRPVAFQNTPQALLPDALKDNNPLNIWRTVNGSLTRAAL